MSIKATDQLPEMRGDYYVSSEQIKEFQANGHICLRGVSSHEEVSVYRDAIVEAVLDNNLQLIPLAERDTYGKAFIQVTNLWESSENAKKFVMAQRFAKVAAELMGVDGVRIYHDQALFKEPGGGHTPWHQDQVFWPIDDKTITMWMPLVDISTEMGSMTFASETNKLGYVTKLGISDESHRTMGEYIAAKGFETVTYGAMNAGDATFHSGWTLHSAPGNPTDLTREVMTIIYVADGALVAEPDSNSRKNDLKRWIPGIQPGELIDSPLNPIVFSKS